jgi:hypothetical protein
VAIKYYGTVFLKVIITIKLIDLPDNFDGYWPVIHYRGIVVMVTIAENWVSDGDGGEGGGKWRWQGRWGGRW